MLRVIKNQHQSLSPLKFKKGGSFLEVLVSLAIVSITLLSLAKLHLISAHENNALYLKAVAEVRVEAMAERLRANQFCIHCEVERWNQINHRVLPTAKGSVSGDNPYRIALMWMEPSTGKITKLVKEVVI